jgi:hypothetical protein
VIEQLEFEGLRKLVGVDCSTSKCFSNAVGTGKVVSMQLGANPRWYMEFHCPDCMSTWQTTSPVIEDLIKEVLAAPAPLREAIIDRWVASRTSCQPWRDR